MEEDVKVVKAGLENIKKIQDMIGGVQTQATNSLSSFTKVKDDLLAKVESTKKQVTDLGNV